jgi:undecaprenyl diphosphate synthase
MDGNGRWAKSRGKRRTYGHKTGAQVVRETTIHASDIGLKYLTLYAFSTENWKRPKHEVEFLMKLLDEYLQKELSTYLKYNVRFNVIGDISKFSKKLQERISYTIQKTKDCDGLTQTLAINYGSKDEIVRAIKKIKNPQEIDEESFEKLLDTKDMPPVDILIRTGGEQRISNFLLWQIAYAELFFTKTLWPDFKAQEMDSIIKTYQTISRRFGGI